MGHSPQLSIVVGTRNRPHSIARLIASVLKRTQGTSWELLIQDASDIPLGFIRDSRIRVFRERPRLGVARGYNLAFAKASGKYCCYLNDDVEVQPQWASEMLYVIEKYPEIGMGIFHYADNVGRPYSASNWCGIPYGNFGCVPKKVGDSVGWYDENLFMYGTDNDLTCKILDRGLAVIEVPSARLYHYKEFDGVRTSNEEASLTTFACNYVWGKWGTLDVKNRLLEIHRKFRNLQLKVLQETDGRAKEK